MDEAPRDVAAGLGSLGSVTPVRQLAEKRIADGDAAYVADLIVALQESYRDAEVPPWQYRSAADHLLKLLAAHDVAQTLRVAGVVGQDAYVASLLAAGHRATELAAAFNDDISGELRACLAQELVLRGQRVDYRPPAEHPLSVLPLTLTGIERVDGDDMFGPWDLPSARATSDQAPEVGETTTADEAQAIGAAVQNWVGESNGRFEARSFRLARDFDEPVDTLLAMNLDCLDGLMPRRRLGIESCPPDKAWRLLFTAAASGGAYNKGLYGAYGRLAAWRSIHAMAGEDAERGSWYLFEGRTTWFNKVAWDLGLAVITPDRRRIAVLAATDAG
ncbi:hypothetical protein HH310_28390 [Actinoplanes sp. TBRC 11911]|uniref:DUF6183 family protein n=1 Tax=Actinoplanes sp. TBRC 11911 TaxID=2729386 RepID=UPI00145F1B0B|nr:DUF6183 family protein [Actinoplanes sp. TBRC 11911]NMO55093.1 hypothetical protein [Actinoplanes sp. TBRC 11911]